MFVSNKEIEKLLSNAGAMSISHQGLIQGIRYLWNESNNSLLRDLELTSTTIIMIALIKVPQIPKMTNFQ